MTSTPVWLAVVAAVAAVAIAISGNFTVPGAQDAKQPAAASSESNQPRVFTLDELESSAGKAAVLRVALLGKVFDVTAGRKHYGSGGGYSFFAGKDASRAFVTGQFDEEGLTDDVEGLTPDQMLGLADWVQFFQTTYRAEGVLEGRFYDHNGNPTQALNAANAVIEEGRVLKAKKEEEDQLMPMCNSRFQMGGDGEVWCTKKSGGVERDWEGVPRQLFEHGRNTRCVCVPDHLLSDPRLRLYEGCAADAVRCPTARP